MTPAARQFHMIVVVLIAFFVMAYTCVDVSKPQHFEPKPLPNRAAAAILYLFARE